MKPFVAVDRSIPAHHKTVEFDTLVEAQSHIDTYPVMFPKGVAAPTPSGLPAFWIANYEAKTVIHDQAAQDEATRQSKRIISFDAFEARFTMQEWDDATDYVYEVDIVTGKPKRKVLVQGLARAQARNSVDLLDPKTDGFLSLLVAGGVIAAARKIVILKP